MEMAYLRHFVLICIAVSFTLNSRHSSMVHATDFNQDPVLKIPKRSVRTFVTTEVTGISTQLVILELIKIIILITV
jgi:hypothetical protein